MLGMFVTQAQRILEKLGEACAIAAERCSLERLIGRERLNLLRLFGVRRAEAHQEHAALGGVRGEEKLRETLVVALAGSRGRGLRFDLLRLYRLLLRLGPGRDDNGMVDAEVARDSIEFGD